MGFLFDIKKDDKKAAPIKQTSVPPSHPAIVTMSDNTITSGISSPEYDDFRQQFANILADENKRNFPGNDYFEFVVMKNAMNAIPQENVRYQAAFAGWMTGGNQTLESLLSTANLYLGLVDKEIKDFTDAYKLQYDAQVTRNQQAIRDKENKIQELTAQIQQLTSEANALRDTNQSASSTLVKKHDAFMAAGDK